MPYFQPHYGAARRGRALGRGAELSGLVIAGLVTYSGATAIGIAIAVSAIRRLRGATGST